jgi:hypothetical protein
MINRETGVVNTRRSPTIRRRRLGAELRRHREAVGITIDVVASRLGCSPSKVSRIARDILDIYGVPESVKAEVVQIAREARQKGVVAPPFLRASTAHMSA